MQTFKILFEMSTTVPTSLADVELDMQYRLRDIPQVTGLQVVETREPRTARLGRAIATRTREAVAVTKNAAAVTVEALTPEQKVKNMTPEELVAYIQANTNTTPTA